MYCTNASEMCMYVLIWIIWADPTIVLFWVSLVSYLLWTLVYIMTMIQFLLGVGKL